MAVRFGAEGASVAVTGRTESDGERVAKTVREAGGRAEFVRLDLSSEASVQEAIGRTVAEFGKLDVIVNNAAPTEYISGAGSGDLANKIDNMVTAMTTEDWRKITTPAIDGLFWTLKYGIPCLQAAGGGSIINISSTASIMGAGGLDGYTASKGAMNALTRSTAVNYQPHIRSNALIAGPYATESLQPFLAIPEVAAVINGSVLAERVGDPDMLATVAVFFASDESKYITGQLLPVDGGYSVPMPIPKIEM
jgi:NAD(P)-dependent dehydrogenase (short-subunit alcohol dehydrogenase family)